MRPRSGSRCCSCQPAAQHSCLQLLSGEAGNVAWTLAPASLAAAAALAVLRYRLYDIDQVIINGPWSMGC